MASEHTEPPGRPVEPLLAEFQCLRTEIEWLVANGMRYQQFAIVITAAGLSASTFAITQHPHLYPSLASALSAVLAYLGILYYWEHVEIHVVAGYLQQVVRGKIRSATGHDTWWEWEEYKDDQWRDKFKSPNLFRTRLLAFLAIALVFLGTALWAALAGLVALFSDALVGATTVLLWTGALGLVVHLTYLAALKSNLPAAFLKLGRGRRFLGRARTWFAGAMTADSKPTHGLPVIDANIPSRESDAASDGT